MAGQRWSSWISWFFENCTRDPLVLFRIFHYPPLAAESTDQWSVGEHTDYGLLTILRQDDVGGLQTESVEDGWIDVPPEPGTIVVNLGDAMQVWTNDTYRAAVHRVTPRYGKPRYSTPYFLNPQADAMLEPLTALGVTEPRYRPFSWKEYITHRIDDNFADLGAEDTQISHYRLTA